MVDYAKAKGVPVRAITEGVVTWTWSNGTKVGRDGGYTDDAVDPLACPGTDAGIRVLATHSRPSWRS